jgi:hypothetical protein
MFRLLEINIKHQILISKGEVTEMPYYFVKTTDFSVFMRE